MGLLGMSGYPDTVKESTFAPPLPFTEPGSVARGEAAESSDLDLLVDLTPDGGNLLLRAAGLAEELSELLGVRVDVVAPALLRDEVSATALADAVAV